MLSGPGSPGMLLRDCVKTPDGRVEKRTGFNRSARRFRPLIVKAPGTRQRCSASLSALAGCVLALPDMAGVVSFLHQPTLAVVTQTPALLKQPLVAWAPLLGAVDPANRNLLSQFLDRAPAAWGALLIMGVVTAAFATHLLVTLQERRIAPQALLDALSHAINAGNYQEAWEVCARWQRTYLARVLGPALERIGQGYEAVEEQLAASTARERRFFTWMWRGLAISTAACGLICLAGIAAGYSNVFASTPPTGVFAPRALTHATGDLAVLAATGFALVAPALGICLWLRFRTARSLAPAEGLAAELVAGLPYEDVEGVRIGKAFDAGSITGELTDAGARGRLRVSRELTTACPICNAPINPSRNPCPHCGTPFEWF